MKHFMLQQIMTAPHEIILKEVPVPTAQPGQVLIKIKRIGVCGSDIHVFNGQHPYVTYPLTQGHEVSGQIVALGEGVGDHTIGQKVTIEPQVTCGKCYSCTHGKYNLCAYLKVMGFQAMGAASEYFAVDASKATPLPDTVSYDEGAMIEPLAVAVHATKQAGDVKGKKVAVIGAGPIGILLVQTLKSYGVSEVIVTDISDYRLKLAKSLGADFIFNTLEIDFGQVLFESFGEDKADIIFDCAGNNTTMGQAIKYARKGSVILLVAVFSGMATIDLAKLNDSEIELKTSMMYRHDDYIEAIRIVTDGIVDLKPLISRLIPFGEYKAAYQYINENRETIMKILIDIEDPVE